MMSQKSGSFECYVPVSYIENISLLMQLAIDEDRRCRSRMRAEEVKAEAGSTGVTTGRIGVTSGSLV